METSFVPSQVRPSFFDSIFGNAEKEVLAAQIVTFLANAGDVWDKVILMGDFYEHALREYRLPSMYINPFNNFALQNGLINGMWELIGDGYIAWVEERKSFTVTGKMVEFYSTYAAEGYHMPKYEPLPGQLVQPQLFVGTESSLFDRLLGWFRSIKARLT